MSIARTSAGPESRAGDAGDPAERSSLVELSGGNESTGSLYLVHGGVGNAVNLVGLANALVAETPARRCFGLEAAGVRGGAVDSSIVAMASRYVGEIRAVQPTGPYLLGGFSIGGGIAMEMAAQLQADGAPVDLVVLLDGHTSLAPPPDTHKLANVAVNARRHGPVAVAPWAWRQLTWKLGRRHGTEMLRRLGYLDPELLGYVDCEEAIFERGRQHRLRRIDTDVLLVKSRDLWPMYPDDHCWTPYVGGRFHIEVAPGDHLSMLDTPNVAALASIVNRYL